MGDARAIAVTPEDNLHAQSTAMGMFIPIAEPNISDSFKECKAGSIFEVHRKVILRFDPFMESKGWEDFYFSDHWLGTAETFSYLHLTYESDKLPALSGLASYLGQRHGQEYYAGIFSGSIAEGLLWAPYTPGGLARPKGYVAPSWSWTSLKGRIKMRAPSKPDGVGDCLDDGPALKSMLEDVKFHLTPEGHDPYGRLRDGNMKLTGWLKSAQICRKEIDDGLLMTLHAGGKRMAAFYLDLVDLAPAVGEKQDVKCLYMLHDDENVLVLRAIRDGRQYERIGIATVDPEWFVSGGGRKESITII